MTNNEKIRRGPALSKMRQHIVEGFSLIEVLLAVFILEIGLLGIATFYAYSHRIAKMARNQTIATNLAQGVMDEQIAYTYGNPGLVEIPRTAYSSDPNSPFYGFDKEVDITCVSGDLTPQTTCADMHMKKIVVTIFWTEDNSNRSVQIATIKAEP